jgi:hypothetical protein
MFNIETLKNIAHKINNLNNKTHKINIFKIIINEELNKQYITQSEDDVYIKFNKLTDETINKIVFYLNNIKEENKEIINYNYNFINYSKEDLNNFSKKEKFFLKKL